jgi:L-threonylcarbamoyladenylate synthase
MGGDGEGGRRPAPAPRAEPLGAKLDAVAVERFAACIREGGVVLFGADTVYGLACDPLQERAVARLYELKGRPPTQPAAVMFFALAPALAALPELGPRTRRALEDLLPGPLTALLPNPADRFPLACRPRVAAAKGAVGSGAPRSAGAVGSGVPGSAGAVSSSVPGSGEAALGLRVPLLPARLAALAALREPILQSSANLSGGPEARRLAEVEPAVRAGADLVIDGGELPGVASTVLDLRDYEREGRWRVVRAGPVAHAELKRALGRAAPT